MKRVNLFLILLIASITALVASTTVGFIIFAQTPAQNNWMGQMWGSGGMMGQNGYFGNNNTTTAANIWLPTFGIIFAVVIIIIVASIVGVAYYLLYPQIRIGAAPTAPVVESYPEVSKGSAYESVAKTLTEDERKIIEVLNAHNGLYLQKYIKSETGLSRLKTHRIIARLADRRIVSLEKVGNTNQVYLANWLNQKA
jgi:uncharacterized membrane protein